MKTIRPKKIKYQFPIAPRGEPFQLCLGNGTMLTVLITESHWVGIKSCGIHGGFYRITAEVSPGYIVEKFRLSEGDAKNFADFLNNQLGLHTQFGEYFETFTFKAATPLQQELIVKSIKQENKK